MSSESDMKFKECKYEEVYGTYPERESGEDPEK